MSCDGYDLLLHINYLITVNMIFFFFLPCICRDLLYKPIVLCKLIVSFCEDKWDIKIFVLFELLICLFSLVAACGHISCFWCVHRSMNRLRESHCPICRRPYNHFPSVCVMLHRLLLKMYPIAYKMREIEILGKSSHFSDVYYDLHTNFNACTITHYENILYIYLSRMWSL